ncbi:MAG TPA: hypothetical protein VJ951_04710, partial [Bacteroidales bacterium]|nr:hypothetical protein [Bacteroidales bacterium]
MMQIRRYMIIPFKLHILFVFCLTTLIYSCSGNLSQTILFEDTFSRLPAGIISSGEGSFGVYHYLPGLGQAGPWKVTAFNEHPGFENAWEIVHNNDHSFLHHNYFAVDENLNRKHPYMHSMIVAGDTIWHDYKVSFEFSPHQLLDQCGLAFKYKNDRSYYYYGMDGNRLVIKMVKHETAPRRPYEEILASLYFDWEADKIYKGEISIQENKIYALMDGANILVAEDDTYQRGKIGFISDVP